MSRSVAVTESCRRTFISNVPDAKHMLSRKILRHSASSLAEFYDSASNLASMGYWQARKGQSVEHARGASAGAALRGNSTMPRRVMG